MPNSLTGTAQVVQVKDKDLKSSAPLVRTWEDIAKDRGRLEWLLYVSKYYRDLFDTVLFDCQQLSNYNSVIYLIDFDVLRAYLDASAKGYDSVFINSIFYESPQKFGIPIGAFLELLDYLSYITKTTHSITYQPDDLPREESIRQIAAALGVKNPSDLDEGEAIEKISERLERKALSLTRLLSVLTDPRYIGVVSTYDEADKKHLYEMLDNLRPSRRRQNEVKANERDAMNLAIALMSIREAKAQSQNKRVKTTAYVLVSKTFVVTDLPDMLLKHDEEQEENSHGDDSFDYLWKLCYMVGLDTREFNLNMHIISNYFPVMHPRRVINAELLGVYESSGNALTSAKELRDNFRKLTDHLSLKAAVLKTVEDQDLYSKMTSILTQEQVDIEARFKEIARKMLSPKLGGIYDLEQLRATSASVDYARRLQQGDDAMSPKDEIKQKSTGLLELLGQVLSAFGNIPGFAYRLEVTPPDEARPYTEIKIGEPVIDGQESFVFGEKYNQMEAKQTNQVYYALRWPVSCPVEKFTNCLSKFLVSLPGEQYGNTLTQGEVPFHYINDSSSLWDEGVVVYANDKPVGFPLNSILWNQKWDVLDLPSVASSIHKLFQSRDILIQQYRINTSFGDFVFDIETTEGETTKYLTVISHYNLASQVAALYENTGRLFALPDKLRDVLSEALQEFKMIPETHQGGDVK